MTFALISDIHGNYEALRAVLGECDRLGVRRIYCLGDVVGFYSQVNECCDELRRREIPSLLGNHDWYMAGGGRCPRSRSVNDCLAYQRRVIRPDHVEWLSKLPVQRWVGEVQLVHGGWSDPIDEYLAPSAEYFEQLQGVAFASGHTHLQAVHHYGERTYCNPGSVGQPRDGDPRAAFAIYDGTWALQRVEYDVEVVAQLMARAGFNDYYYGCLYTGARELCRPPGRH